MANQKNDVEQRTVLSGSTNVFDGREEVSVHEQPNAQPNQNVLANQATMTNDDSRKRKADFGNDSDEDERGTTPNQCIIRESPSIKMSRPRNNAKRSLLQSVAESTRDELGRQSNDAPSGSRAVVLDISHNDPAPQIEEVHAIIAGLSNPAASSNKEGLIHLKLPLVEEWIAELLEKLKNDNDGLTGVPVSGKPSPAVTGLPSKVLAEKLSWLLQAREEALQNIMKWQTTPPQLTLFPHWTLFPRFAQRTDFAANMQESSTRLERAYANLLTAEQHDALQTKQKKRSTRFAHVATALQQKEAGFPLQQTTATTRNDKARTSDEATNQHTLPGCEAAVMDTSIPERPQPSELRKDRPTSWPGGGRSWYRPGQNTNKHTGFKSADGNRAHSAVGAPTNRLPYWNRNKSGTKQYAQPPPRRYSEQPFRARYPVGPSNRFGYNHTGGSNYHDQQSHRIGYNSNRYPNGYGYVPQYGLPYRARTFTNNFANYRPFGQQDYPNHLPSNNCYGIRRSWAPGNINYRAYGGYAY
jgi:hypothetical protein